MEAFNLCAEGESKSVRRFRREDARRARDTKHFDTKKRDGVRCLAEAGSQVWGTLQFISQGHKRGSRPAENRSGAASANSRQPFPRERVFPGKKGGNEQFLRPRSEAMRMRGREFVCVAPISPRGKGYQQIKER